MLIDRLRLNLVPDNSPDRFKIMYLLLAVCCLATILSASVVVISWQSRTDLRGTVVANSERIVDSIYYTEVDAILVRQDRNGYTIALHEPAREALNVRIRDMYDPLNILRLIVFDRDRKVIYGNKNILQEDHDCEKHVEQAFTTGEIIYHLHRNQTITDLVGEKRVGTELAEVYVPIRHKNGQIMGVFTVSSDVTRMIAKSRQQMINSVLAQTAMLLLISLVSYIFITRESAELKMVYQKLESLATTDPLTGISNRRQLLERAEQHFALQQRSGDVRSENIGLGFVMIDIDFFKQVNDTYGHRAGDSILQEMAAEINKAVRQYDVFGRYGGEEFLLVLPSSLPEEVEQIGGRLVAAVREHPFLWYGKKIPVTLSAGVTWTNAKNDTLDEVLIKVDSLLYEAKQLGRNRVVYRA